MDIGDDVFVIDDNDKTTWRLQVKSADASFQTGTELKASFAGISRAQLRTPQAIELLFMFLVRTPGGWRKLVIPRVDLFSIRDAYVEGGKPHGGRGGRPPVADDDAKSDSMTLVVTMNGTSAIGWTAELGKYLDCWPEQLPVVQGGPGSTAAWSASVSPEATNAGEAATTALAEIPDPSPDRER